MGRFDFLVRDTRKDTYFCKSIELLFQIPKSSYAIKMGVGVASLERTRVENQE